MIVCQTDAEAFAHDVADFLRAKDYPILGVQVWFGGSFPLVTCWDDEVQMSRVIVCTDDQNQMQSALHYAQTYIQREEQSGMLPAGCLSYAMWPGGWSEVDG